MRKSRTPNARLEALLDERDHLLVKMSLTEHSGTGDPDQIKDMRLRLALLNFEIDDYWSAIAKARPWVPQGSAEEPGQPVD